MYEKEIKILNVNKNKLIKSLISFGAQKIYEGQVHDIYYDYAKGEIDQEGRSFRVRNKGGEHIYTIKQKEKEKDGKRFRMVVELEHKITNVESFKKVLEKYGLVKSREKKKQRTSYQIGDVVFDIDKYPGIPTLLEIEGDGYLTMKLWIEKLGLQSHLQKKFGSRGLFKYYQDFKKDAQSMKKSIKKTKK